MSLIVWIASPEGHAIIAEHKKKGEALFYPDAAKEE